MKKFDMQLWKVCLLIFMVLFVTEGCTKKTNPDGREDVSGTITLNGKPLEGGSGIRFDPVDGDHTAGGSGQIMTGKYLLTGQDGVKPGKYIVRIHATAAFDKRTNTYATNETDIGHEYSVKLVPDEFNMGSKIEFEVLKGKKNVFNYDIVTDFKPERVDKREKRAVE